MSIKISISVNLSDPLNWETDYLSLTYTIQNVIEKAIYNILVSSHCEAEI